MSNSTEHEKSERLKRLCARYFQRRCQPLPVSPRNKRPLKPDWQHQHLTYEQIAAIIDAHPDINLGVLLGSVSEQLVDIDIDEPKAIGIFHRLMSPTASMFGRRSKPGSHRIYRVRLEDLCVGVKFPHPVTGRMIAELRANGEMTVFPGSTHESGEEIEFVEGFDEEPAVVSYLILRRECGFACTGFLLAEHWIEGSRHNKTLAFAGVCATNNIPERICENIIRAIVEAADDEELEDRLQAVRGSYRKFGKGESVGGMDALRQLIGDATANKLYQWMEMKPKKKSKNQGGSIQNKQQIAFTDLDFAIDFATSVHGMLLYCDTDQTFYENNHGVYTSVTKTVARGYVHKYLDRRTATSSCDDETRSIKRMMASPRISAILEEAQTKLRVSSSVFDGNPTLAGCANGLLDIEKGILVDTHEIITRKLGTHFDPNALCPSFERFLSVSLGGDVSLIALVQRALGYTLTASTTERCMFVCVGSGSNGKSTLESTVFNVMGDYARPAPIQTLVKDRFNSFKTDDIAALDGCRYAFTQEGESEHSLAVAKVKRMTGGDPISVRSLYKDPRTIIPTFKLWFFTNKIPKIDSADEAIWQRLYIIPFDVTITEAMRIPDLSRLLDQERPGILNWMIRGYQEYVRLGGLHPPPKVIDQKRKVRSENDTVEQFVECCCDTSDQNASTPVTLLHGAYVVWCQDEGSEPIVKSEFGKGLERLGYNVKRTNRGSHRLGIRLTQA